MNRHIELQIGLAKELLCLILCYQVRLNFVAFFFKNLRSSWVIKVYSILYIGFVYGIDQYVESVFLEAHLISEMSFWGIPYYYLHVVQSKARNMSLVCS